MSEEIFPAVPWSKGLHRKATPLTPPSHMLYLLPLRGQLEPVLASMPWTAAPLSVVNTITQFWRIPVSFSVEKRSPIESSSDDTIANEIEIDSKANNSSNLFSLIDF